MSKQLHIHIHRKAVRDAEGTARWVTLKPSGTHVKINASGQVVQGPTGLVLKQESPHQGAVKKLTSAQIEAIRWYQHHGYKSVNKGLRSGNLSKSASEAVARIDESFSPTPKTLQVYRGSKWVEGHPVFGARGGVKVGSEFSDPAYVSTSAEEAVARSFTNATAVKVTIPKGHRVLFLSDQMASVEGGKTTESEVLLPRGTKFRVTEVEHRDGIPHLVHLEIIE